MTDFGIAVGFLRSLRGWSREQVARAAGLHASSIGRLENGRRPRPGTPERIRRAFGLSLATWQRLLDLIADCRHEMSLGSALDPSTEADPLEETLSILVPRILAALTALPSASVKATPPPLPAAADRRRADELWGRLRPLSMADRRELIAVGEEYSCWALAERLAQESEKLALDRSAEALALAGMADRIAETAPMPSRFRARLRGLTTAYLGYARRVAGHLEGAEAAFRRSDELWTSGAGGDPAGSLDDSRRLALKTKH
ncbi:MAG: helix-turn-helix domain-containing protein [Acidobacteriota bacterium]